MEISDQTWHIFHILIISGNPDRNFWPKLWAENFDRKFWTKFLTEIWIREFLNENFKPKTLAEIVEPKIWTENFEQKFRTEISNRYFEPKFRTENSDRNDIIWKMPFRSKMHFRSKSVNFNHFMIQGIQPNSSDDLNNQKWKFQVN